MSYSKEELSRRSRKYREENRDRLLAYDRSPERKAFHKAWLQKKRQEDPCRFIYYSAKRRAKVDNIPFDLVKQDIYDIYPSDGMCPMLGIKLTPNISVTKENSPSLDRLIPERGYVKGNVIVISHKANRIKSNATLDELEKVVKFLQEKKDL